MYGDASFSLTNVRFDGNSASSDGGGLYFQGTYTPSDLAHVTFIGNTAGDAGGGMYGTDGTPTTPLQVSHVSFIGNTAGNGGGLYWHNVFGDFQDVTFSDNVATNSGGGMYLQDYSGPYIDKTFDRIKFIGNSATRGGGLYLTDSYPKLLDAVFKGNSVAASGGGIFAEVSNYQSGDGLILANALLSGNTAVSNGGAIFLSGVGGAPPLPVPIMIINSTFTGNVAGLAGGVGYGGGLYSEWCDPTIANSIFWNNQDDSGTGSNAQIYAENESDPVLRYSFVKGGWPGYEVKNLDPRFSSPEAPSNAPTTAGDYHLKSDSPAMDAAENASIVGYGLASNHDLDGRPRRYDGPVVDTGSGTPPLVDVGAYEWTPMVFHVKTDASGSDTGLSWSDAFTDLQDALAVATAGDEIWVAAGIYKPTGGVDRTVTFQLKNGVAIYGGFAGTENDLGQHDWEENIVVLSGDLNEDDNENVTVDEPTRADNSYRVVTGSGTDGSAVLDGVVVASGNAGGDTQLVAACTTRMAAQR